MYISIDIGGTNTRVVGSEDLNSIQFVSEPLRRRNEANYEREIDLIIDAAQKIGGKAIQAIGIGLPGTLSEDNLQLISAKNNSHWNQMYFVEDIRRRLRCDVFAENDAVAAALGEAYYGEITDADFAYIIWGTGLGGVYVRDKHEVQIENLNKQWSKYFEQWEMQCGGRELSRIYGKEPEDLNSSEWEEVFSRFGQNLMRFFEMVSPSAVVFGGGLSNVHRQEIKNVCSALALNSKVSAFGDDSGLYGGFGVIKKQLK